MTLQRLNIKSNVNAKLFNDIRQNLINLRQNQCQICIQWILSCKSIIENEKADQLIKSIAQESSTINNMKAIIISFVKKQICKKTKLQWLNVWKSSIKKKNQYQKHILNVNLSHKSLKKMRKIDRLTFSIFIQLKMRHDYFKSYLHRLSENNSNKCYEICNARQTSKHLLLNCKHYSCLSLSLSSSLSAHQSCITFSHACITKLHIFDSSPSKIHQISITWLLLTLSSRVAFRRLLTS